MNQWRTRLALVLGLGLTVATVACGRNTAAPTSPSAANPSSLDHTGTGGHKHFTVSMTSSVPANQTGVVLSVTVTNCGPSSGCAEGASTHDLGSAQIVLPAGFTITTVGGFDPPAQQWTGTYSGQTVV